MFRGKQGSNKGLLSVIQHTNTKQYMTNKFIKSKKLNEDKNVESIGHAEGFCNMSYPLFEGRFVLPNLVKQF